AGNRSPADEPSAVPRAEELRLGTGDRPHNKVDEVLPALAAMGFVRPEEFRPTRRLVAVGDVLDQAGDPWIDSRFSVEVAVLDVAEKAAHRLSSLPVRRCELDAHDAALGHWASTSTIPIRS